MPQDLYAPFVHNNDRPNRLAIVDPNKADNNISGGTAEIDLIFDCFSEAYNDLHEQMTERERSRQPTKSLLADLLGGDYEAYAMQRERLRRLYSNRVGTSTQSLPPTGSLSGPLGVALPNAAGTGKQRSNGSRILPSQTNGRKDSSGNVSNDP
jgi:hypothetical protein